MHILLCVLIRDVQFRSLSFFSSNLVLGSILAVGKALSFIHFRILLFFVIIFESLGVCGLLYKVLWSFTCIHMQMRLTVSKS